MSAQVLEHCSCGRRRKKRGSYFLCSRCDEGKK